MIEPGPATAPAVAATTAGLEPFAPPCSAEFFRASFRPLVEHAMYAGATREEAEDAAAETLKELIRSWGRISPTLAYARKAVVHNFLKEKTRGPGRVARRLVERGHVPHQEGADDDQLAAVEAEAWLADVLSTLSPAQRKVTECIARGLDRDEIASDLGMSGELVRRHLCDARKRLAAELHPDGERRHQPQDAWPDKEEAR